MSTQASPRIQSMYAKRLILDSAATRATVPPRCWCRTVELVCSAISTLQFSLGSRAPTRPVFHAWPVGHTDSHWRDLRRVAGFRRPRLCRNSHFLRPAVSGHAAVRRARRGNRSRRALRRNHGSFARRRSVPCLPDLCARNKYFYSGTCRNCRRAHICSASRRGVRRTKTRRRLAGLFHYRGNLGGRKTVPQPLVGLLDVSLALALSGRTARVRDDHPSVPERGSCGVRAPAAPGWHRLLHRLGPLL